jgi:hypothetical protein
MAKQKKRAAKKSAGKAKPKRVVKKAEKKTAAKSLKPKKAVKSKAAAKPVKAKSTVLPSKPVPASALAKKPAKLLMEGEPKKPSLPRAGPSAIPKDPDLDEELGGEEVDMSGEGEMDEDIEEELTLDDEDEDVDYLEKSEELLDDSDDYHTH